MTNRLCATGSRRRIPSSLPAFYTPPSTARSPDQHGSSDERANISEYSREDLERLRDLSPSELIEDISHRNLASILEIDANVRRTIFEIMGWQGDTGSGSANAFGRINRGMAEAAVRIERLRAGTIQRLFGGAGAEASPSNQRALPPAEADVIEAELIDDGEAPASSSQSSWDSDAEIHRDYMELFGITDPDAARKKYAEIQRKERERVAQRR